MATFDEEPDKGEEITRYAFNRIGRIERVATCAANYGCDQSSFSFLFLGERTNEPFSSKPVRGNVDEGGGCAAIVGFSFVVRQTDARFVGENANRIRTVI